MINSIHIDLGAIAHNFKVFQNKLDPKVAILVVVKARAYGHGLIETSKTLIQSGAQGLVVFSAEEALKLRAAEIKAEIMTIGYPDPEKLAALIKNNIIITVAEFDQIKKISQIAVELKQKALIDIKVETGLNRFGFPVAELLNKYPDILALKNIQIVGLHSHFAEASNKEFTRHQLGEISRLLQGLRKLNIKLPRIHIAATDGSFLYPEAGFDAVRIGIGLYGYSDIKSLKNQLKPALSLTTKIGQIKTIQAGESVSYMRTYVAKKTTQIAILPIGYADGLPRALSNVGSVLIVGKQAKIIGRICMNVTIVDITGLKCREGDVAILIGRSGSDKIDVGDIAKLIGTNPHEILTGLSQDLPRIYI